MPRFTGSTNIAAEKSYRIVEHILTQREFTQYSIEKALGFSHSHINAVCGWLEDKLFIRREKGKYIVRDAAGIIIAISMQRSMKNLKRKEIHTSLSKKELLKIIPSNAIFCMDSALDYYSTYWRSERICIYLDSKGEEALSKKLFYNRGKKTTLYIYEKKPKLTEIKTDNKIKFTPMLRTIIDMACDNKIYAVEGLIKKNWSGKK